MQRTVNYDLCQYEGSDKTSYLINYNGDMLKIDTAIKGAKDAADNAQSKANTADGKADANAASISTLDTQINGAGGVAADVSSLQGSVNTINSLIGNGEPTTQDKTLIGAINELNGYVTEIDTHLTDRYVLDAVDAPIATVTADGVKTFADLISELATAIVTFAHSEPDNAICELSTLNVEQLGSINIDRGAFISNLTTAADLVIKGSTDVLNVSTGNVLLGSFYHDVNATALTIFSIAKADASMTLQTDDTYVPASGVKITVLANLYEKYDI